ncbi:MAG: YcgN family cysteine cluster protein [Pseudomonadota bacterium]
MTHKNTEQSTSRFWEAKQLSEMTRDEWEKVCDGCGRCCLLKAEDEDTGEIHLTRLACRLLDRVSCRCGDYANRRTHVPDCIALTLTDVATLSWLPPTCGYRRLKEGRGLAWWHPLVSGTHQTVHDAGISVQGQCIAETEKRVEAMEDFIVAPWPADTDAAA